MTLFVLCKNIDFDITLFIISEGVIAKQSDAKEQITNFCRNVTLTVH